MPDILIRRATADDAAALVRLFSAPRAMWGTLQVPYTSEEARRRRHEAGTRGAKCPFQRRHQCRGMEGRAG